MKAKRSKKSVFTISIYRRPWYEWLGWAIWFALEIFFVQSAIASTVEYEARAATIFWAIFVTLALGGVAAYISRRASRPEWEENQNTD